MEGMTAKSDLGSYLLYLAEKAIDDPETVLESGKPGWILTKRVAGPDGFEMVPDCAVFRGRILFREGSSPRINPQEAVLQCANRWGQLGGDRIAEMSRDFTAFAASDIPALLKSEDQIVKQVKDRVVRDDGSETMNVVLHELLEDPLFGKMGKSYIAWSSTVQHLTEEGEFFSLPHVLESLDELDCSVLLAQNGFYKQALQTLRTFLEGVLLHLYFCVHQDAFRAWKAGTYRVPRVRGRGGLTRQLLDDGVLDVALRTVLDGLYEGLNANIHGAEARLIHRGVFQGETNGVRFEYARLVEWMEAFAQCVDVSLRTLWIAVVLWEATKPEGIACFTCHAADTLEGTDRVAMGGVPLISLKCAQCGSTPSYAAEYAAQYGYI